MTHRAPKTVNPCFDSGNSESPRHTTASGFMRRASLNRAFCSSHDANRCGLGICEWRVRTDMGVWLPPSGSELLSNSSSHNPPERPRSPALRHVAWLRLSSDRLSQPAAPPRAWPPNNLLHVVSSRRGFQMFNGHPGRACRCASSSNGQILQQQNRRQG